MLKGCSVPCAVRQGETEEDSKHISSAGCELVGAA